MKSKTSALYKYLIGSAWIFMACLFGGCTLAVPDAGTEGAADQLIGAFITSDYLDLYDMEGYLNDHAGSLMKNDSITVGNDSRYAGKLMATVDKEKGGTADEWKISFGNVKGEYLLMPAVKEEDGSISTGSLCSGGISDTHLDYKVTDEGKEQELKGTIYLIPDEGEQIYYVNPVYQMENGEIYVMSGNSYSNGNQISEGNGMAATLFGESELTKNGKSEKTVCMVSVQFAVMYKPVRTILYQMNEANQVLKQTAYTPSKVPDTLKVEPGTAYIIEEIRKEKPDGEMINTRTILNLSSAEDGECFLEIWYPVSDGRIGKKDVEIRY